ncbi:MAG: AbrB/MazE/SpoVT family DNA-binding domain-containing protein [Chloroflexi bacterium]|nr:AbrB/MazE/SpoVT family DNA-binding domain-containing protein [Chloroflexota bacterium]
MKKSKYTIVGSNGRIVIPSEIRQKLNIKKGTVHWPLYCDEKQDETDEDPIWKNFVFLAEGYQHLGENLMVGDLVLVYETASAPRKKSGDILSRHVPDGKLSLLM